MAEQAIQPPLDTATFLRIRKWYILALSGIALMIIIAQVLIQQHLSSQLSDSRVINLAGRQRAYSQKLVKEALILTERENGNDKGQILGALRQTLQVWKTAHQGLQFGSDSLGLPAEDDPDILKLYDEIRPYHQAMVSAAERMLAQMENPSLAVPEGFFSNIRVLLDNERQFLRLMDTIVNVYDQRSKAHLQQLKVKEYILLAVALLILLLEMLFIFRPLSLHIRNTISRLMLSQKRSEEDAGAIRKLYGEKERSLQALQELNFVIDNAALFASIKKDGTVVFISKKFLDLLGYTKADLNKPFSEVLTTDEGQQQYLREILKSNRKAIRSEEIRIHTLKGEELWLDMSIIPMPHSRHQQSILLLCSDITERKKTQMQVEKLTRRNYEESIRQKQLQASQIVEGQEEERKRIAKDIHDGIGQMLTALKFNIESINLKNREKTAEKISYIKDLTTDLIKGVRTATFNLTPPELTDHGIIPALQKMSAELARLTGKNILFENRTEGNIRLNSLAETNIYRVVQEAVNNAIKYANSKFILVAVNYTEGMLSIIVDDDGSGFDDSIADTGANHSSDGGMGLFFMKERISYINGRLFINSEEGKGTRVTINYAVDELELPG
jgi:PAS domain S-box-containing protein